MEKFQKINLNKIVKWTLPGLFFIPSSCAQNAKENIFPDKPNIVFIIADDMNWDDCSAYGHFELTNLIGIANYEGLLTRMRDLLEEYMTSTNDSIPEKRTPDEFDRVTGVIGFTQFRFIV